MVFWKKTNYWENFYTTQLINDINSRINLIEDLLYKKNKWVAGEDYTWRISTNKNKNSRSYEDILVWIDKEFGENTFRYIAANTHAIASHTGGILYKNDTYDVSEFAELSYPTHGGIVFLFWIIYFFYKKV